jgi:hypothetical protein
VENQLTGPPKNDCLQAEREFTRVGALFKTRPRIVIGEMEETGPSAIRRLFDRNLAIRHNFYSLLLAFSSRSRACGNLRASNRVRA